MRGWITVIVLAGGVLGGLVARELLPAARAQTIDRSAGQQLAMGRYQVEAFSSPGGAAQVVVVDTATARCWLRAPNGSWLDYGTPLPKAQTIALPQ